MRNDKDDVSEKVNPWFARSAAWLIPIHFLAATAYVGLTDSQFDPAYLDPLGPLGLVLSRLGWLMPYTAVGLSIVNWCLKTWRNQRTWRDTCVVALTVGYALVVGPIFRPFVA